MAALSAAGDWRVKAGVVLPSSVRRQPHLEPGTRFQVAVVAGHIELTTEAEPAPLVKRGTRRVLAAAPDHPAFVVNRREGCTHLEPKPG